MLPQVANTFSLGWGLASTQRFNFHFGSLVFGLLGYCSLVLILCKNKCCFVCSLPSSRVMSWIVFEAGNSFHLQKTKNWSGTKSKNRRIDFGMAESKPITGNMTDREKARCDLLPMIMTYEIAYDHTKRLQRQRWSFPHSHLIHHTQYNLAFDNLFCIARH